MASRDAEPCDGRRRVELANPVERPSFEGLESTRNGRPVAFTGTTADGPIPDLGLGHLEVSGGVPSGNLMSGRRAHTVYDVEKGRWTPAAYIIGVMQAAIEAQGD